MTGTDNWGGVGAPTGGDPFTHAKYLLEDDVISAQDFSNLWGKWLKLAFVEGDYMMQLIDSEIALITVTFSAWRAELIPIYARLLAEDKELAKKVEEGDTYELFRRASEESVIYPFFLLRYYKLVGSMTLTQAKNGMRSKYNGGPGVTTAVRGVTGMEGLNMAEPLPMPKEEGEGNILQRLFKGRKKPEQQGRGM